MNKKTPGAQTRNLNGLIHGCYRSLTNLDGRTRESRILGEVEAELATAMGGDPSPQQVILIQRIAVKSLRCFLSEVEILKCNSDGQKRERLERDYLSWSNSLRADLQLLGMGRIARPVRGLQEYMEETYGS